MTLHTHYKQFCFKKGMGCSHALYTVRQVVERFIKGGNTVNLCAIDLSKAFDKVNHHVLLTKLIKRNLPVDLLDILENWFKSCFSSVEWLHVFSPIFVIKFGVRQGSVLSPFYLQSTWMIFPLFALLSIDPLLCFTPMISC